jgi:hypothetical protein
LIPGGRLLQLKKGFTNFLEAGKFASTFLKRCQNSAFTGLTDSVRFEISATCGFAPALRLKTKGFFAPQPSAEAASAKVRFPARPPGPDGGEPSPLAAP